MFEAKRGGKSSIYAHFVGWELNNGKAQGVRDQKMLCGGKVASLFPLVYVRRRKVLDGSREACSSNKYMAFWVLFNQQDPFRAAPETGQQLLLISLLLAKLVARTLNFVRGKNLPPLKVASFGSRWPQASQSVLF